MTNQLPTSCCSAETHVRLLASVQNANRRIGSIDLLGPAEWLARHGRAFDPPVHADLTPGDYPKRNCFQNAFQYAQRHGLAYFEGWATVYFPTEHAWCVDADGRIVDPTWGTDGLNYFGAEFTIDTLLRIQLATEVWGVFSDWTKWLRVQRILEKSRRMATQ